MTERDDTFCKDFIKLAGLCVLGLPSSFDCSFSALIWARLLRMNFRTS
jgi:hypothetical protein